MKSNIEILSDIASSLKNYIDEKTEYAEAKILLSEFSSQYQSIRNNNITSEQSLKGVLHSHTVNNFSKITALFSIVNKSPELLAFSGEDRLIDNIINHLMDINLDLPGFQIIEHPDYRLYITNFKSGKDIYSHCSISSSDYFDIGLYRFNFNLIKSLYSDEDTKPQFVDNQKFFFETVNSSLMRYGALDVVVYVIKNIYEIFSHVKIKLDSSFIEEMISILRKSYGEAASISALKGSVYAVLLPSGTVVEGKRDFPGMSFMGITLPASRIALRINNPESFNVLLSEIVLFSDYINSVEE